MSSRQTRRGFLKTASMAGASVLLSPSIAIGRSRVRTFSHFGLHPFIEAHPQAVFILRTNVDAMTNAPAIKTAAELLGKTLFVGKEPGEGAYPLSSPVILKPNLTNRGKWDSRYTVEGTRGVMTDVSFVEGIIGSIKTLGVPASSMSIREANYLYDDFAEGGYIDLAARTGVDMKNLSAKVGVIDERELNWMDVPEGVWFHRIPYLRPINTPGSVLINVAKLKTHAMGMTLCAKNLQGTIAAKYVRHCAAYGSEVNMEMREGDMNPAGNVTILQNYERHKQRGVPRWDRPDPDGGLWQETWATRCLDNNSVLHPFLNIIEGIYGRDGHFVAGPNDGLAKDYLANVVLFGKNAFHVDLVGSWLAGHEPGNFGLFHMAIERNLCHYLNPMNITLYEWGADGSASPVSLSTFPRTPLKTHYLRRDYNGQNEDPWHLVNEPFDYSTVTHAEEQRTAAPRDFALHQNYPNPFNPRTSLPFGIPDRGNARLEVFNIQGELVDVLLDASLPAGDHLATWEAGRMPSGVYLGRLSFNGYRKTRTMVLIR